jgi:hypothetical protein
MNQDIGEGYSLMDQQFLLDLVLNAKPEEQMDIKKMKDMVKDYSAKVQEDKDMKGNYDELRDDLKSKVVIIDEKKAAERAKQEAEEAKKAAEAEKAAGDTVAEQSAEGGKKDGDQKKDAEKKPEDKDEKKEEAKEAAKPEDKPAEKPEDTKPEAEKPAEKAEPVAVGEKK